MQTHREKFSQVLKEFCNYSPEAATNNTKFAKLFHDSQKVGTILIGFIQSSSELQMPCCVLLEKSLMILKDESSEVSATHDHIIDTTIKLCKEYALLDIADF